VVTNNDPYDLVNPLLTATNSFTVIVNVTSNNFRIVSIVISNGIALVTWTSIPNNFYRLQYINSLSSTNWNNVTPDVMATNQTTSMTNALGNSPQHFYRVMLVQYSNLPAPVIQSISLTNGVATLVWSTVAGHTYQLQYKTNLTFPSWNNVTPDVTATSQTASATSAVSNVTQQFYRVLIVQ
jgi:hypothetical protein